MCKYSPHCPHLARPASSYVRSNFWITTSGYFDEHPFTLARNVIGDSRIMFAVDYPFSDNSTAISWLDSLHLDPGAQCRLTYGNAEQLLGLTREQTNVDADHE
jgi:predicted TIM-barrel fold metal-dependent hydrolase